MVFWFPLSPYFHIKQDPFYGISVFIAVFLKKLKAAITKEKRNRKTDPNILCLSAAASV